MECTCNAKALVRTFGLMTGLVVAGAASAESGLTSLPQPVEILKKDTHRVSAEVLLNGNVDRTAVRGATAPFTCPTGGGQQDLVNGPDFVGFAVCGVFNPIDNFIPAVNTTPTEMCVRGDYRISFSSFPADLCPGIGIDADALVGWSYKLFNVDGLGQPTGAPAYTASTDAPLGNLTVQRFAFGETYANTPGGRPIITYHLAFADHPQLTANTCYWFGICWDPTVNGNPDLADCTWRWGSGFADSAVPLADPFVIFDNNPADDVYGFCSLSTGAFDWVRDFTTVLPDPNGVPCLDASLAAPPTNETCSGAIALTCDADGDTNPANQFCPVLAENDVDSLNDPPISCVLGGTGADFLNFTTWYTIQPTDTQIIIEMCRGFNDGWDSAFAIYREADAMSDLCAELAADGQAEVVPMIEFACADDVCGNDPQVCLSGLTPGETLYIQVGSLDNLNTGEVNFNVVCSNITPPPNDDCSGATLVAPGPPFFTLDVDNQDTTCAALDDQAIGCGGTSNGNSPGLWYQWVGDGNIYRVSGCEVTACGPGYDQQLNIYCGDCDCGLVCIAGTDDTNSSCAPQEDIEWCSVPGETYYIYLHGFFDKGCAKLRFQRLSTACTPDEPIDCTAASGCDVDTTGVADYEEVEPCIDGDSANDTNGGCSFAPANPFEDLGVIAGGTIGYTVEGTSYGANNLRDLDWYAFSVTERGVITLTIESEFDGVLNLQSSADCATNQTLNSTATAGCQAVSASFSQTLDPGTYVFFVSINDFNGFPCDCRNEYRVTIDYRTFGACCLPDDTCTVTSEENCLALGGEYSGDSTDCGVITYTQTACMDVFSTIQLGPISQLVTLSDEDAEFFNLGFNFSFFGNANDSVAIISNGYLAFGDLVGVDPTPEAIPDADTPNNIISALWTDLDPATGSGEVWVAIDSISGNAVFEWLNVGTFDAGGAVGNNDVQVQLNGSTGCIKLIYGDLDLDGLGGQPTSDDMAGILYTVVGLENIDGTAGNSVDLDAAPGTLANSCIEFCPMDDGTGACDAGVQFCEGDANFDGVVDVNDLSFVIFRLGNPGGACIAGDANGDGANDVNDLSYVIFRLGDLPADPCNPSPCPAP